MGSEAEDQFNAVIESAIECTRDYSRRCQSLDLVVPIRHYHPLSEAVQRLGNSLPHRRLPDEADAVWHELIKKSSQKDPDVIRRAAQLVESLVELRNSLRCEDDPPASALGC